MYCLEWQYINIISFFSCHLFSFTYIISYIHILWYYFREKFSARLPSRNYFLRSKENTQFVVLGPKNLILDMIKVFLMFNHVSQTAKFLWIKHVPYKYIETPLCYNISFLLSVIKSFYREYEKKKYLEVMKIFFITSTILSI